MTMHVEFIPLDEPDRSINRYLDRVPQIGEFVHFKRDITETPAVWIPYMVQSVQTYAGGPEAKYVVRIAKCS